MRGTDVLLPEVYVQPGESHLLRGPAILRTVLGSCVGVTFRHPRLSLGALCHPMLPRWPGAGRTLDLAGSQRYVDFAIHHLASQLDALGARRAEIEVKLFGGADVLGIEARSARPTVGRLNRAAALQALETEGFAVAASRLGGTCGLHLTFNTVTGEVWLRRLQGSKRDGSKAE
jgi:chemotaxis protein CheD